MTDARYPERWLTDRRLLRLSDAGHRLFVHALVWSVSNRTDGLIEARDLDDLPRNIDIGKATELEAAGLWQREGTSWFIVDFGPTQTSRHELDVLDNMRRAGRDKKARQRAAKRADQDAVPGDVPGDTSPGTAQARPGQARTGKARRGVEAGEAHEVVGPRPTTAVTAVPDPGVAIRDTLTSTVGDLDSTEVVVQDPWTALTAVQAQQDEMVPCKACSRPTAAWITERREGHCIVCWQAVKAAS